MLERSDRFRNRLPLLTQQLQRWGQTATLEVEQVPIVYAQPISADPAIAPAPQKPGFWPESLIQQPQFASETGFLPPPERSPSPCFPNLPIVTSRPAPLSFTSSETTLVQAKFVSAEQSPEKPGFWSESSIQPPQLASETGFLASPERSPSPSSPSFPFPHLPIVTSRPAPSSFTSSETTLVQAKFASAPQKPGFRPNPLIQQPQFALETGFLAPPKRSFSPTPHLPIVTSRPAPSGFTSSETTLVQAKFTSAQQPSFSMWSATQQPRFVQTTGFPSPAIAPAESSLADSNSAETLPRVEAQPIPSTQSLAPLIFSTVRAGSDRMATAQSRDPTSFPTAHSGEGISRFQETATSSLAVSAPTGTSPFAANEVNQTVVPEPQAVDLEAMVTQVERRLLRRLVIESERRGQHRWGLKS
jgi:hypothetical protein